MNAVVFYSNTSQSRGIAEYFAEKTGYALADIEADCSNGYKNLVLVFPVHCQNIPDRVKAFLKEVTVENLTVIATYGKVCGGNVLFEIQNKYHKNIVAGAYVPTKHSYIDGDTAFCDFQRLDPIFEKIQNPSVIKLPKLYKNPFADLFPTVRSRLGLKIRNTAGCNGCNFCAKACPLGAIEYGKTNKKCIRCLRCVGKCPKQALSVKLGPPLKLYLKKSHNKNKKLIIYI